MSLDTEKISAVLYKAKEQGIFSKAVAGFVLPDGTCSVVTLNTPDSTIFDIASLTKVCPTSTLALKYILEETLSPSTPVAKYIPELQTNYRDDVRLFHLLTHSLDYRIPMKTLRTLPPQEILDSLYNYQFNAAPGTIFNYGNPPSVLLGILLSRMTGKTLHELGQEHFFGPLGMTRSGWDPLKRFPITEIMPTEKCEFRGREIQGEIHDESAWVLRKLFPVGSAGMFSTVPDLLRFVQMVLGDGLFQGKRIMPKGVLDLVSNNALDESVGEQTGLGWELNNPKFMGTKVSKNAFGKTGFTGASIVADPQKKAAVVLLSNFTYPTREENADRINAFRALLSDEFFGNLK
ncbi:MAG: beta-lactamase family protein [Fibrobacteraceae bacterium]|nr:beta-lactamase family protein [Fibrobacteraceae bacterium]